MSLLDLIFLFIIGIIALIIAIVFALTSSSGQTRLKPQYGTKSVTLNGEEVKSIAERKIADYFRRNNIKYVYEKELRKIGLFHDYTICCPDFYLPDYDVYVEYWGLVDADDEYTRKRYVRNMKQKMAIYYENKIKFISLYPRNLDNLDWIFRTKLKQVTGYELAN